MPHPGVTCSWATADAATRAREPELAAAHAAHEDLLDCDAWICSCGNTREAESFEPVYGDGTPDESPADEFTCYRCARCGAIYRADGEPVGG